MSHYSILQSILYFGIAASDWASKKLYGNVTDTINEPRLLTEEQSKQPFYHLCDLFYLWGFLQLSDTRSGHNNGPTISNPEAKPPCFCS